MRLPDSKILDLSALLEARQRHRCAGDIVVWTNGCFDLLHPGHVRSLQSARRLGDVLIVGVNSDASVRRLKGAQRPVLTAPERAEMLAALTCVDYVTVFDEDTPNEVLAKVQPNIHCKGAEYAPPNGRPVPERDTVLAYGGRIEYLPLLPSISTTELIRRVCRC